MIGKRTISHTEVSTVMDCWARHSFAYTGHLTGGQVLKRKQDHVRLREGRAWGRAVAELHDAGRQDHLERLVAAFRALNVALDEDAAKLRQHGLYVQQDHHDLLVKLTGLLCHYAATAPPMHVHGAETELRVPLPSRTGKARSNRFVFHGYLDALTDSHPGYAGRLFIVEYKLRDRLTDLPQIIRSRQIRRYAWAAEQQLDEQVHGVIVDERLNEVPKPARWVKGKKKTDPERVPSQAKDQLTTRELYEAACQRAGVDVDLETAVALGQRQWQQRHVVLFKRSEVAEAGSELVSAAQLIAQLDSGALFPVRNTSPMRCGGCPYSEICADPDDADLVDLTFARAVPKRLRTPEEGGLS